MRKVISLTLTLVLLLSLTTFAQAKTLHNSREIDEVFDKAIETLNANSDKINYLKEGVNTFEFTTSNHKKGTVEVKIEKVNTMKAQETLIYDVDDGSRINTTTIKFDSLLGGEMVLVLYYDVSDNVTKLTATGTEEHASAPVAYTLDSTDSWITKRTGQGIGGTISARGTYTIKLLGSWGVPITKNLDVNIKIHIPGESVNVWYSQSA